MTDRLLRPLLLALSIALALLCLVWPLLLVDGEGRAAHAPASLLFAGVALGLPSGLNFRVGHPAARALFHPLCPLALMAAGLALLA